MILVNEGVDVAELQLYRGLDMVAPNDSAKLIDDPQSPIGLPPVIVGEFKDEKVIEDRCVHSSLLHTRPPEPIEFRSIAPPMGVMVAGCGPSSRDLTAILRQFRVGEVPSKAPAQVHIDRSLITSGFNADNRPVVPSRFVAGRSRSE
jgi:hypothetical protein